MVFSRRRRPKFDAGAFDSIIDGLKTVYRDKIRPLEEQYMIKDFHYPLLNDSDFDARPMIMLVGQYSTGKTSFIKFLLEQEFPNMHIGPEPTTDKFQAILYGPEVRELPGNALVSNPATPFFELSKFGNTFLGRFAGCEVPSDFSRGCTLIDTPGILAGKKQTEDRQYSFESVVQWFAPRVDMILLMFDAHKVDISDEFKSVIQSLEGYDDKIRVVMNKSDSLEPAELLKINSALTWSLSRILKAPEVRRIYVGSFWDEALRPNFMNELFEKEAAALLTDLNSVPRNNTLNKVNDVVSRARMVRVQALIMHQLRAEMPKMTGKDKKQRELIAGLEDVFFKVMKGHSIPVGDFPDVNKFRSTLASSEACRDFTKFKKLDDKLLAQLDAIIGKDIGQLMTRFDSIPAGGLNDDSVRTENSHASTPPPAAPSLAPLPNRAKPAATSADPWAAPPPSAPQHAPPSDPWSTAAPLQVPAATSDPWANASSQLAVKAAVNDPWAQPVAPVAQASTVVDGLFGTSTAVPAPVPAPAASTLASPFGPDSASAGVASADVSWVVSTADKAKYDSIFAQMQPDDNGKVSGAKVAPVLKRSMLPNGTLHSIWSLVDVNKDGQLDQDFFAVAMHLTMRAKRGDPLPKVLPVEFLPPSAR
mmetsp:Transcript_44414/g.73687  ORF Transcript_44414/g.73687 Transcript_44414/m.73687 type:complete len:647 (+) Transcript_44414:152-2092(+)|eukprot:CAMPEP_0119315486 /NCGR_PEP_ID=MMETSP1333-20130426/36092_1 /TAXON_ID=418940 /ORGANISM="Scyphosphaera apsteinii, Strain RCC1455" /LENGTH=646 /DNA_ID=CAMNT_0007320865 /DNA_START=141 /DNA_END=2081 /DNA_ORIENTATION=+